MKTILIPLFVVMVCVGLPGLVRADGAAPDAGQVRALARQLESAVKQGNGDAAASLFDVDAATDRAIAGVAAPPGVAQGFRQGLKSNAPLIKQIAQNVRGGGYRFLRARQVGGETRVLFRMVQAQGGLNYHDWVVGTDAAGQLKFVDLYTAASGELMSQTLRRAFVMAAAHANPTLIERLTGRDRDFVNNIKTMQQITGALRAKRYQDALNAYGELPKSLQDDKNCMLLRLAAAQHLKAERPNEYEATMNDFARLFPGDPCLDLVCLDGLIEQKKFDQARQSLDRLKTFTGGDPYLGVMRGNLYLMEGGSANFAAARNEFETAKSVDPGIAQAYWGLVELDLKTKDFDRAAAELTEIQHALHMPIGPLEGKPAFAEFVKSDAYRKWKAAQRAGN